MTNGPKEKVILKHHCPICGKPVLYAYNIELEDSSLLWYSCSCGVVFREEPPEFKYDFEYLKKAKDVKEYTEKHTNRARIYSNLLEESTSGRKLLDVGFQSEETLDYMRNRGWLCWGIDKNEHIEPNDFLICADFEEYKFYTKFDVVWLQDVFHCFKNPIAVIQKCYDITSDMGILVISTPNIDFINEMTPSRFPHWSKEAFILWSMRALCRELERFGFQILMKRNNYVPRTLSWYTSEIIAQKYSF